MPHTGLPSGYATPYEAVHQRHVDFKALTKHVHPYGCLCFLLIPKSLRAHTHGVAWGMPCVNLGFSTRKEGFVVLALSGYTVIDGVWNVFFIEDRFPIAELHAEKLQQGLPAVKLPVTARWKAVDLSWSALTNGDYSGEPLATSSEEPATEPDMTEPLSQPLPDPAVSTSLPPTEPSSPSFTTDTEGLARWSDMPRLEPTQLPAQESDEVTESTALQIKKALQRSRTEPASTTASESSGSQPSSG